MKKEEFPTFLNEQPTIIFGRTGRELLIMVSGAVLSYKVWDDVHSLLPGFVGGFLGILLATIILIAFIVLALVKIGYRPLEEWIFSWFLFVASPKIYLYKPWEVDVEYQGEMERNEREQVKQLASIDIDELEED
jgi:hypothetical protein